MTPLENESQNRVPLQGLNSMFYIHTQTSNIPWQWQFSGCDHLPSFKNTPGQL